MKEINLILQNEDTEDELLISASKQLDINGLLIVNSINDRIANKLKNINFDVTIKKDHIIAKK